jgi:hypothetical protein
MKYTIAGMVFAVIGFTSGWFAGIEHQKDRFDMDSWEAGLVWGLQSPAVAHACLNDEKSLECERGISIMPGETATVIFNLK